MATLMKDGLGKPAIQRLAQALGRADKNFDAKAFTKDCLRGLSKLELKQRVEHVIGVLYDHLPQPFDAASRVLRDTAKVWDAGSPDDALAGFAAWPLIDYVGVHGVDDFELGMSTLREVTGLFTAEFAIRPFIESQPERALELIQRWLGDQDAAVRRLCSEGIRPLLPWGKRVPYLSNHPEAVIGIIEQLRDDESDDVRRSVANTLNDISKSSPELVIQTCQRWLKQAAPGVEHQTKRLVQHATRTLVKQGHVGALAFHGAGKPARVSVRFDVTPKRLELGDTLTLNATLTSTTPTPQKLLIDFVVHHQKANQQTSAKVFKWKVLQLPANGSLVLQKRHPIRQITTRRYYPGRHRVELLVNGRALAEQSFALSVPNAPGS